MRKSNNLFYFLILLFCSVFQIQPQTNLTNTSLDVPFSNFSKTYQETSYVHLNKSTYLTGEMLGFTAYIFHKQSKLLSKKSKNLYCKILDKNNKVISEKLFEITNGIANGVFEIREDFKEGNYKFIAFTNWMLNFNSNAIFSESFSVINPSLQEEITKAKRSTSLDIQVLPESGHFLSDVRNTVGIIIKDTLGFGVGNIEGDVLNNKNKKVTSFTLNTLGIGRFTITPNASETYKISFTHQGKKYSKLIKEPIYNNGITLNISRNRDYCIVSLITNKNSLLSFKGKNLKLGFHDGNSFKITNIKFDKNTIEKRLFKLQSLSKGINIFTLFDENNKPIAERLFFNYIGLRFLKSTVSSYEKKDTISQLTLNFKDFKIDTFNNISIAILPQKTKSYNHNNNIIAQSLLKPYIKGNIENASYYFKEINNNTIYDLDNLLITQGWSSYDWSNITNKQEPKYNYAFENGISIKVNVPKKELSKKFMLKTENKNPVFVIRKDSINRFSLINYFPKEKQVLDISGMTNKGKLIKPSLYVQFFPSKIPNTHLNLKTFTPKRKYYEFDTYNNAADFMSRNRGEVLNEIIIKANLEKIRRDKIKRKSFGRVIFLDKYQRSLTLAQFIDGKSGVKAYDSDKLGAMIVRTRNGPMELYLDNMEVTPLDFYRFYLDDVDYVDINTFNPYNIRRFPGGRITVKIDPKLFFKRKPNSLKFKFPLTFTANKRFYLPEYGSYTSTFYKNYGAINWLPKNSIDKNGNLKISFTNKFSGNFTIFMEGYTDKGDYIFEKKKIDVK